MPGTLRTNPFAREFGIPRIDRAKLVVDGTAEIVEISTGMSYMYNMSDRYAQRRYA